jgi:phosphate-selective porin
MMRLKVATASVALLLSIPALLLAQEAPPTAPTPTPTPTAKTATAEVSFKNAFTLQTPDGANQLRLGVSAHFDARAYGADSVAPGSFDIRRARLDTRGKVHDFMTFRIQASLEDNPYIRNAWVDLRWSDPVHLQLGQMKVPFSTEWMTFDNQVNFLERATSEPVYTFFDRGVLLWGDLAERRLTYQLGAFTGAGVDADATKGDIDDHKDVVLRLFAQPFRKSSTEWLQGLYLAVQGTSGSESVPTRRYETRGLTAPNYESQIWRWRTEQVIGTDGRNTDQIAGRIDSRQRWGAELHYLKGPFTASFEWLEVSYDDVAVNHEYWTGSTLVLSEPVFVRDGAVRSAAAWFSLFLTGERKSVEAGGWRQPDPKNPYRPGAGGSGAWEILARVSNTRTDDVLFSSLRVDGFDADEVPNPVGEGNSVRAAVMQGASDAWEGTLGLNWTVNPNLRLQLNLTRIWAPDYEVGVEGIVSGGNSDLSDPEQKNRLVETEDMVALRFIFRL